MHVNKKGAKKSLLCCKVGHIEFSDVRFLAKSVFQKKVSLRLILMRSDSELRIFTFRSEKRIGRLMQSDVAKSDGTKSDLRIRWPNSSDFGPGDSAHRILK